MPTISVNAEHFNLNENLRNALIEISDLQTIQKEYKWHKWQMGPNMSLFRINDQPKKYEALEIKLEHFSIEWR